MCFSGIGQIIFGIIMVACLALTAASMFSSDWRTFKDNVGNTVKSGIWDWNCDFPGGQTSNTSNACNSDWWKNLKTWEKVTVISMCLALATELLCLAWNVFACFACCCKKYVIHPLTLFATLVAVFLGIAVIVYGVNNKDALACMISKGESFWKDSILKTNISGSAFDHLADESLKCLNQVMGFDKLKNITDSEDSTGELIKFIENIDWGSNSPPSTEVGYSFYMAIGALALALIDIVIAGLSVCLAEKCC